VSGQTDIATAVSNANMANTVGEQLEGSALDPDTVKANAAQASQAFYATQYAYSVFNDAANGAQQLYDQSGGSSSTATDGTPTTYMPDVGGSADATSNFDKVQSVAKFLYDQGFPTVEAFAKVCLPISLCFVPSIPIHSFQENVCCCCRHV